VVTTTGIQEKRFTPGVADEFFPRSQVALGNELAGAILLRIFRCLIAKVAPNVNWNFAENKTKKSF
jgi:hypothetical protein